MGKLKEIGLFILCIAIILASAYFTGFLKGFTPSDFQDAYNQITSGISKAIESTGLEKAMTTDTGSGSKNTTIFKNYKAFPIPESAVRGQKQSGSWSNIFNSRQKVVFYIYDHENKNPKFSKEFHSQVSSYFEKNNLASSYNLAPVTLYYFDKLNWGNTGPDKMCNSIQECNEYRQRASDYSLLSDFLRRCGKTMCVINPGNLQYVMLKSRDSAEAIKMLNSIKTW